MRPDELVQFAPVTIIAIVVAWIIFRFRGRRKAVAPQHKQALAQDDEDGTILNREPITKAIRVKIDTSHLAPATIKALRAAEITPDAPGYIEPVDARSLRYFKRPGMDLSHYALSCPYCGWCEAFTPKWVKTHDVLTCNRCDSRTLIYRTVSADLSIVPVMCEAEWREAYREHPEVFKREWVPSGPDKQLAGHLSIAVRLKYTTYFGEQVEADFKINSIRGHELANGFKLQSVSARRAEDKTAKKIYLHLIENCIEQSTGAVIRDVSAWLAELAHLPISPE